MQEVLGAPGKCSMIFVKCQNAAEQEAVAARILEKFPGYSFFLTRELPQLFANGIAALNVFLNVVKGTGDGDLSADHSADDVHHGRRAHAPDRRYEIA